MTRTNFYVDFFKLESFIKICGLRCLSINSLTIKLIIALKIYIHAYVYSSQHFCLLYTYIHTSLCQSSSIYIFALKSSNRVCFVIIIIDLFICTHKNIHNYKYLCLRRGNIYRHFWDSDLCLAKRNRHTFMYVIIAQSIRKIGKLYLCCYMQDCLKVLLVFRKCVLRKEETRFE